MENMQIPAKKSIGINPKSHINLTFLENSIEYQYTNKEPIVPSANVVACLGTQCLEYGSKLFDIPKFQSDPKISLLNNSITLASVTFTKEEYPKNSEEQPNKFPPTIDCLFSTLDDNILKAGLDSREIEEVFNQNNQLDLNRIINKDKFTKQNILDFYLKYANIIIYFVKKVDKKTVSNLQYLKDNKESNTKFMVIHICDNDEEYSNEFNSFSNQVKESEFMQKQLFTLRMKDYIKDVQKIDENYNTYFIEYLNISRDNYIMHLLYVNEYESILKLFLRQHLLYDSHVIKFDLIESFKSFMEDSFKRLGCTNAVIENNTAQSTLKISGIDNLKTTPESSSLSNAFQANALFKITHDNVILTVEYPLLNSEKDIDKIIEEKLTEGRQNRFYVHKLAIEKGFFSIRITGFKENDSDLEELEEDQIYFSTIQKGEFFVEVDLPPSDNHGLILLKDPPRIEPIKKEEDNSYIGVIKITYDRIYLKEESVKIK